MKVHLIKKNTIDNYGRRNAQCRSPFRLWLLILKGADWNSPEDMQASFGWADILGNGSDRVVFNIGGNHYRMIAHYVFGDKEVHLFVCWIGTHAEYSALCSFGEQYIVSEF